MSDFHIYLSSVEADRPHAELIRNHLYTALGRDAVWVDAPPGIDKKRFVKRSIAKANVVLVLLSVDYINATQSNDLDRFVSRRLNQGKHILFVMTRYCLWQGTPWIRGENIFQEEQEPLDLENSEKRFVELAEKVLQYKNGHSHQSNLQYNQAPFSALRMLFARAGVFGAFILLSLYYLLKLYDREPLDRHKIKQIHGIAFVKVESGSFVMGASSWDGEESEKPLRPVELNEFWIGKYEVTNKDFRTLFENYVGPSDDRPVTRVTWLEAQDFCDKRGFKLPSEAQWEYAARSGRSGRWAFGNKESELGSYAWFIGNAQSSVNLPGLKLPNAWGIYDMHGNAREWVYDHFAPYQPSVHPFDPVRDPVIEFLDPVTRKGELKRVVRGGSFADPARSLRSASRSSYPEDQHNKYTGFRCVITSPSL